MAIQREIDCTEVVQVGNELGLDISRHGPTVSRRHGDYDLGSWGRRFDNKMNPEDMKPSILSRMWWAMHEFLLSGQNMRPVGFAVRQDDGIWRKRFAVVRELSDKNFELGAGDVVRISTGVHGRTESWIASVHRGDREVVKLSTSATHNEFYPESHVYELYRLAMMAMAQHLNPRGLCVCVWEVYLEPFGLEGNESLLLRHGMNNILEGHGTSGLDMSFATAITTMDFMVLPLGTKAP